MTSELIMAQAKVTFARIARRLERGFDSLRNKLRDPYRNGTPQIVPYLGFGSSENLFLKGRLLLDRGLRVETEKDNVWKNLTNMYKRFNSAEIGGARIRARFQDAAQEVVTDEEGFFDFSIFPKWQLETSQLWHDIELELLEWKGGPQKDIRTQGKILVPPPQASFGIISDMDDTVIQTDAGNLLRMIRTTLFGNARTRLPFKGVAAFYQALHEGRSGKSMNPLFYVSSSPWNLYDLILEFFRLQNIPVGPVFLRDWGITETEVLPTAHRSHKMKIIRHILDVLHNLPFILIGDSSQEDPEIYEEIVTLYPNRIIAIYIRNVSRNLKRAESIQALAEKVLKSGSTLILADDTLAAARHAIEKGWISPAHFPDIQLEKEADETKTEPPKVPTIVVENESRNPTT
jgi:phosphatidate phosphatase APP1